jgi:monoamine oxidase
MSWRKTALVIGGGIAGLTAAQELTRNKIFTTVIEAKDRFGGRIHTIHDGTIPIELGAEFVHGQSQPLLRAIRDAKLKTKIVSDEKNRFFAEGKFRQINLWNIVGDVINRVDIRRPDCSFEDFLKQQKIKEPAASYARHFVMGFDAADPKRAGAHALRRAEYSAEQRHMETQSRVVKGYSALVEATVEQIKEHGGQLVLNTKARHVRWKNGHVEVVAEQNKRRINYRADVAVIALPLPILKSNEIKFEPSLPEKIEAANEMEWGNAVKIVFHFKEVFWDDLGFLLAFDEAIPTWWSDTRGPMLTGWAGGPKADKLLKYSKAELETMGLKILRKILFRNTPLALLRKSLVTSHYFNWADDPQVRGAYSYIPVNGLDLPKLLAAPVAETLFFAGEATVTDAQTGTVFGALESGLRAAREVLHS